jgi:hypothetical protein
VSVCVCVCVCKWGFVGEGGGVSTYFRGFVKGVTVRRVSTYLLSFRARDANGWVGVNIQLRFFRAGGSIVNG